jgi:hypothetical protein
VLAVTTEENDFVAAFVAAIVGDVSERPTPGPLARIVVRWFDADDPLYFTIHALGADERDDVSSGDAWYPLEWPNAERELVRADRISGQPGVASAGAALRPQYEAAADERDDDAELGPSPAILAAVRALPAALGDAGVAVEPDLAISAAHFEGYGALEVLEAVADAELLEALSARDELPVE